MVTDKHTVFQGKKTQSKVTFLTLMPFYLIYVQYDINGKIKSLTILLVCQVQAELGHEECETQADTDTKGKSGSSSGSFIFQSV